ncbi:MAG: DUF1624 domain-containing protein [Verrucomicrobiaceae bacterium]|nr:DUF1624 domain-containing protein [Verrucomicrobiaceae bacterium]
MQEAKSDRLLSIDALRGFDMCWILGLSGVLRKVTGEGWLSQQMTHVDWEGFRFYDLIFPLFLFLSGVSLAYAVPKRLSTRGVQATVLHLLWRGLILTCLGILLSGGVKDGWEQVRWLGVLQRIGIASMCAGMISIWFSTVGVAIWASGLLLGYCLLLGFVPVPGFGAGDFREGHNLTNYLDKMFLPGRKYDGEHDPEGLLSTLPAIATALLGILAGKWLKSGVSDAKKSGGLIAAGVILLICGWAWHPFFPVIKKIWTSSFVLVSAAWSSILLGVFCLVVDQCRCRRWTLPFVWVGSNPILLYLLSGFGAFSAVAARLGGTGQPLVSFGLMLALAWWLHKQQIVVKV